MSVNVNYDVLRTQNLERRIDDLEASVTDLGNRIDEISAKLTRAFEELKRLTIGG